MTDQRLEDEDQRAFGNVVLLVAVAALIGGGIWIASVMLDVRQVRDCAAAGGQLRADRYPRARWPIARSSNYSGTDHA
jgi:hypothetical protein